MSRTISQALKLKRHLWPPCSQALGRRRLRAIELLADETGSQITDNLGLIVIGVVAVVALSTLISGLDKTVFTWITGQLGLSS